MQLLRMVGIVPFSLRKKNKLFLLGAGAASPRDMYNNVRFVSMPIPYTRLQIVREEGYNRFNIQQGGVSNSVFIKIFLAISRSDEKIEFQQIYRRICYYVFAKLHQKHKSIDPIVQEIENALLLVVDTGIKVYHHLRIEAK